MIFPAVILEPVILEGQSPDRNGGDRIRRYRIIVVTSLMMAVGLIAGGFLRYNMGGLAEDLLTKNTFFMGKKRFLGVKEDFLLFL